MRLPIVASNFYPGLVLQQPVVRSKVPADEGLCNAGFATDGDLIPRNTSYLGDCAK